MTTVLDASALLAWLFAEPGMERVETVLVAGAVIHTVNLAEVYSKLAERGVTPAGAEHDLTARGILHQTLIVDPGTPGDARRVGELRTLTRPGGLSLGDRYCLALAERLGVPALTADAAWTRLSLPVTVTLLRP
jgi:ribonuclease VapC